MARTATAFVPLSVVTSTERVSSWVSSSCVVDSMASAAERKSVSVPLATMPVVVVPTKLFRKPFTCWKKC